MAKKLVLFTNNAAGTTIQCPMEFTVQKKFLIDGKPHSADIKYAIKHSEDHDGDYHAFIQTATNSLSTFLEQLDITTSNYTEHTISTTSRAHTIAQVEIPTVPFGTIAMGIPSTKYTGPIGKCDEFYDDLTTGPGISQSALHVVFEEGLLSPLGIEADEAPELIGVTFA